MIIIYIKTITMAILWVLLIAFGIHTLDNMWVNWLNYKISTQVKDKEDNNNGVEETGQTHTMGFTQGYQLKDDDGEKEEG